MRVIVGFGNDLRGEDGFGVDVIKELQKHTLANTKLISTFQLTPELALNLKEYDEIIFLDAAYSETEHYALACNLEKNYNNSSITHHISIFMIVNILNNLYNHFPQFTVYSMLTNSFENIKSEKEYQKNIKTIVKHIKNL